MSLIRLRSIDNGDGSSTIAYYNNVTKMTGDYIIVGYVPYTRTPGEIVDVYPFIVAGVRRVVTVACDGTSHVVATTDINSILLKTVAVAHALTIYTYNKTTREVEVTNTTSATIAEGFAVYSLIGSNLIDSYCAGTNLKELYHDTAGGLTIVITANSVTCGFVIPTDGLQITEKLRVKIDNACYDNGVYLKWKNSIGGWDQWLFHTYQLEKKKTESLGSYEVNFTDLEDQDTISESRGKKSGKSIIIGAEGLTDNDLAGIEEILDSKKVYWIKLDGSQVTVEVADGTFNLKETVNKRHSIELEILLPETFTITE